MVQRRYDINAKLWSGILVIYGYGIDLAHSLNYCGIIVTRIDKDVRLVTIRKMKGVSYPEIAELLFDDLFKRYPPSYICTDFTNEKAFSETMEARLNPPFIQPKSKGFYSWKIVEPVVFTMDSKLALKQNAREMLENKHFVWPQKDYSDPRIWSLVEELKQQMLREAGTPTFNDKMKFPKPQGHDNDLIIAFEINLFGAKKYLPQYLFQVVVRKLKTPFRNYFLGRMKKKVMKVLFSLMLAA